MLKSLLPTLGVRVESPLDPTEGLTVKYNPETGNFEITWTDPEDKFFRSSKIAIWFGTKLYVKTEDSDYTLVADVRIRDKHQTDPYIFESPVAGTTYEFKTIPYSRYFLEIEDESAETATAKAGIRIRFMDGDSVLSENWYSPNETPTTPEVPAKNEHEFDKWIPSVVPAQKDADYQTSYKHIVTYLDALGGVFYKEQVSNGASAVYEGRPEKEDTDTIDYEFLGWSIEDDGTVDADVRDNITSDITLYPVYSETEILFTVRFIVDGASVQSKQYKMGETPVFEGDTSTLKDSTGHEFDKWDKDLAPVTGHTDYTAVFKHIVSFYEDSTLLGTSQVSDGMSAVYNGSNPTKEAVDKVFSFSGWSRTNNNTAEANALDNITADISVYVCYTETPRTYTITWESQGITVKTEQVVYGETPSNNDVTADNTGHEFDKWNPVPYPVNGNQKYTAVFKNIIRFFEDGTNVLHTEQVSNGGNTTYTGKPTKDSNAKYDYEFKYWADEWVEPDGEVSYGNVTGGEIFDSWDAIAKAVDDGVYKDIYQVGYKKSDGNGNYSTIIAFDTDDITGGGKAPITWISSRLVPVMLSTTSEGAGTFDNSTFYRQNATTWATIGGDNVTDYILQVDKYCLRADQNPLPLTTWPLSVYEVLGSTSEESLNKGNHYSDYFSSVDMNSFNCITRDFSSYSAVYEIKNNNFSTVTQSGVHNSVIGFCTGGSGSTSGSSVIPTQTTKLTNVNSDADVYPYFEAKIRSYNVKFNYNGTTATHTLPYGTDLTEVASQYEITDSTGHEFDKWNNELVAVTGNAEYTATYKHIVNFYDSEDNIYRTIQYSSNELISTLAPNLERYEYGDNEHYDYQFLGWAEDKKWIDPHRKLTYGKISSEGEILDSWEEINEAVKDKTYSNVYKKGNWKRVSFGSEGTARMQIAGFNQDMLSMAQGASMASIVWVSMDALKTRKGMAPYYTPTDSYSNSSMREHLTTIYETELDPIVQQYIVSVMKSHRDRNGNESTSGHYIWIPSLQEVVESSEKSQFSQVIENRGYNYFPTSKNDRIRYGQDGQTISYWLRTMQLNGDFFHFVDDYTNNIKTNTHYATYGVIPCFDTVYRSDPIVQSPSIYDISSFPVTEDMDIYAIWEISNIHEYPITINRTGRDPVVTYVKYGKMPSLSQYESYSDGHQFDYWVPEVKEVDGPAEYTAVYKHKVVYYQNYNNKNSEYHTEQVSDGKDAIYTGYPAKSADTYYTYEFKYWTDEWVEPTSVTNDEDLPPQTTRLKSITEDIEVYPFYKANRKMGEITVNYDGKQTKISSPYGLLPDLSEYETPDSTGHEFDRWDVTPVVVTGNATYTAIYKNLVVYYSNATNVFHTEQVSNGQSAVYTGKPTLENTVQYTYSFDSWTSTYNAPSSDAKTPANLNNINSDINVYAHFTYVINEYEITFLNWDGTELEKKNVVYGKVPTYTGPTPVYSPQPNNTTHNGWDKTLASVTGTETYTAKFDGIVTADVSDTWATIYSAIENDTYKTKYHLGDTVLVSFGDEGIKEMEIVGFDAEEVNGVVTKSISFMSKQGLKTSKTWNDENSNVGGYIGSDLNKYMENEVWNMMEDGPKPYILAVDKSCRLGTATGESAKTRIDKGFKLWIPSGYEFLQKADSRGWTESNGPADYSEYFTSTELRQRKNYLNKTVVNVWVRGARPWDEQYVCLFTGSDLTGTPANSKAVVIPGFTIGLPVHTVTYMNGEDVIGTEFVLHGQDATGKGLDMPNEPYKPYGKVSPEGEILDSWEQINLAMGDGVYKEVYNVGNWKTLPIDDEELIVEIADFDHYSSDIVSDGNHIVWVCKTALAQKMVWSNEYYPPYDKSEPRKYLLNTVFPKIQNIGINFINRAIYKQLPSYLTATSADDPLWLLAECDVQYSNVLEIFKDQKNLVRYSNKALTEEISTWYLATTDYENTQDVLGVYNFGSSIFISRISTSEEISIIFGFCTAYKKPRTYGKVSEEGEILDSWEEINEAMGDGVYDKVYELGNYKYVDFGSEGLIPMEIVGFNKDEYNQKNKSIGKITVIQNVMSDGVWFISYSDPESDDWIGNYFLLREGAYNDIDDLSSWYFVDTVTEKNKYNNTGDWVNGWSSHGLCSENSKTYSMAIIPFTSNGYCKDDITFLTKTTASLFPPMGSDLNQKPLATTLPSSASVIGKAPISWIAKDILKTPYKVNTQNTNSGGYNSSSIKLYLENEIWDSLDNIVKSYIIPVNKTCRQGSRTGGSTETINNLSIWLPSVREMFVEETEYEESEGCKYDEFFKEYYRRYKHQEGQSDFTYWLRTSDYSSTTDFCAIDDFAHCYEASADSRYGVVPGFCTTYIDPNAPEPEYPGSVQDVKYLQAEGELGISWKDPDDENWTMTKVFTTLGKDVSPISKNVETWILEGTITEKNKHSGTPFGNGLLVNLYNYVTQDLTVALVTYSNDGYDVNNIHTFSFNAGLFMT